MAALRVSYQGEPGAYSEDAARRYFAGSDIELRPCATFADAMRAVKDGVADHAVIPSEEAHVVRAYCWEDIDAMADVS